MALSLLANVFATPCILVSTKPFATPRGLTLINSSSASAMSK